MVLKNAVKFTSNAPFMIGFREPRKLACENCIKLTEQVVNPFEFLPAITHQQLLCL